MRALESNVAEVPERFKSAQENLGGQLLSAERSFRAPA
jgi:hypothetical protein